MRILPLKDRALVELDPIDETFCEGALGPIVRPDIAKDKPRCGTVRGVGPGIDGKRGFRATTLQVGDRVSVPWGKGVDLKIGGRLHVFVREFADGDIVGVEDAA